MNNRTRVIVSAMAVFATTALANARMGQLDQLAFRSSLDHPAIEYWTRPTRDPVATLSHLIDAGAAQLRWQVPGGYLRSVLDELHVPVESQIVVFAKNSLQSPRITPQNPRTLFFNDSVVVGWVGGGIIELAAVDPQQGVVFYTVESTLFGLGKPRFVRESRCLQCHESYSTLSVPGMLVKSVLPSREGISMYQFGSYLPDHRTKFEDRWGGWYVTGGNDSIRHMGNQILADPITPLSPDTSNPPKVQPQPPQFDSVAYLSPYSDIVALMVFDHQMHMTNLLTRVGWEFRVAADDQSNTKKPTANLQQMTNELVDYLLFVEEAPLPARLVGTSGFAEKFTASGPRDRRGRSLRQLDLQSRLLRYPCSYMIYADAFDGLPAAAKEAIYRRMWQVLSGADRAQRYARLTLSDRQAIVDILRETKNGLPDYFQPVIR